MTELQPLIRKPILTPGAFAPIEASPELAPIAKAAMGGTLHDLLPAPSAPDVTLDPRMASISSDPLITRKDALEADLYKRSNPISPTTTLGKIGHVAAGIGNVLGNIFAPATMALIPGTDLHNERIRNRDQNELEGVSKEQTAEGRRKQQAALTDYTEQRPDIERGKIRQRLTTALVPKGFTLSDNPDAPGGFDIQEDPESQAYHVQAAKMMHDAATAERQHILAGIGEPGTAMYADKQRQLAQLDQRIAIADRMASLRGAQVGINQQSLNLREDQNYNPEPTAQERIKGDLAQSAVHQVGVMRDIVNRRKDLFGPAAGSGTSFQTWLGSEDPDAAAYNAAQTYLAEHSAGVFGGRGAYILKGLHSLSNQRQNPDALNSFLNEAEGTAKTFVKAGTTHAKGQQGHAATTAATATAPVEEYERVNGKLVKKVTK